MVSKLKKPLALMLMGSMGMALLAGCGSSSEKTTTTAENGQVKPAKSVTVFTPLPDQEIPAYAQAFEKETGIKLNYVRLSAGEMTVRVKGEKGHPTAAVMWGGSTDNYEEIAKDDLLIPYQSKEVEQVPEQYRDPNKTWNPFYIGAIGFACNTDWFNKHNLPLPKSWADLLKPELKGQIMVAHPSTSGAAYTVLASVIQLMGPDKGWDYMKQLNQNIRQYTKSGAAPANSAGLGECAVAIVFSHDGLKPKTNGYPIEMTFPEEGTGYEVGALALIKGADPAETEAGKLFIDWCLSQSGQEAFIAAKSSRLPLNTKAEVTPGLTKIGDLKVIKYDAKWAGENKKDLLETFNQVVADKSQVKK